MKQLIYTIISLLVAVCAQPLQAAVKIHGVITDEKNEPLEFVTVKVMGAPLGTTSGLDGAYSISVPDADTVRITFTCIGYEDSHRRLLNPKKDVTLNVKMSPALYTLGEVAVTAYKKQTDGMQKIEMDRQRLVPDVSGGSVESLLTTMAGVNSNNEMSSQYSVRGGSYDENLVYINGIEVYRPQLISSGQQEGLSIINPDMVGSVNFSTGGFPARYGDKMSSVLDITYRQPEAFEGSVSASLMGGSVAVGTASRRFSQLHGLRYKSNSSLLSGLESRGEYDPKYFDYQTNLSYKFSQKLQATFMGNAAINRYTFIPATRTTRFGTSTDAKEFKVYFDGAERDRFETFFGALNLDWRPAKHSEFIFLASGYLTNELVSYDISGEYWLDQASGGGSGAGADNPGAGGELGVGRYHEHARNRLKASVLSLGARGVTGIAGHSIGYGGSLNFERIFDRAREWELRDSAGFSLPLSPDGLKVIYNLDSRNQLTSKRAAVFLEDNYRLDSNSGYFNFNGGLRLSYWGYNREWLLSPRLSVGFVPDGVQNWSLRAATGVYYQSPFYKEYRMPVIDADGNNVIKLNNEIKSQRSIQLILGSDYTFRAWNRPFKVSAEAYYKALSNLIPYEVNNLKIVYSGVNATRGYATGLDMKLFGQFVPGTDSWLSLSLMRTRELLNGVWVPRPTDQRYSLALFFTDFFPKWPRLKFNLRGILSDGMPVTPPRGSRDKGYFRAPAYKRVDIGFAYNLLPALPDGTKREGRLRWVKNMWLGLDAFNLFDISNVSSYYWVTDVNNIQYAVPNYLTRRQLNLRLSLEF